MSADTISPRPRTRPRPSRSGPTRTRTATAAATRPLSPPPPPLPPRARTPAREPPLSCPIRPRICPRTPPTASTATLRRSSAPSSTCAAALVPLCPSSVRSFPLVPLSPKPTTPTPTPTHPPYQPTPCATPSSRTHPQLQAATPSGWLGGAANDDPSDADQYWIGWDVVYSMLHFAEGSPPAAAELRAGVMKYMREVGRAGGVVCCSGCGALPRPCCAFFAVRAGVEPGCIRVAATHVLLLCRPVVLPCCVRRPSAGCTPPQWPGGPPSAGQSGPTWPTTSWTPSAACPRTTGPSCWRSALSPRRKGSTGWLTLARIPWSRLRSWRTGYPSRAGGRSLRRGRTRKRKRI